MLDTIISSTTGESFTLTNTLIILGVAIILGVLISIVYMKTNKVYTEAFPLTLIMLPVIISIIILLVGNNVARAFSLAGAFSIIRFRSSPGNPKDLSYVFFTLAVGLALGMGYIGYGVLFTIILCVVMIILAKINFGDTKGNKLKLKITIPENMNYEDAFNDILDRFTTSWKLVRVKTKEFGALYELSYEVVMNPGTQKQFMDEVRTRNGNLTVSLTMAEYSDKSYV